MNFTRKTITMRTALPPEKREHAFFREHTISAMVAEGTDFTYYQPPLTTILGTTLRRRHILAYQIGSTSGAILVSSLFPRDEATAQGCIQFLSIHPQATQSEIERYACEQGQWYHLEPLTDEEKAALTERKAINEALTTLEAKGYRDVTELVRPYYQDEAPYYEELYLCTLQQPNGEPLYCRTAQELFAIVETARLKDEPRTAQEPPEAIAWTLVGNFGTQEKESNDHGC
jgi:hypothetical protein